MPSKLARLEQRANRRRFDDLTNLFPKRFEELLHEFVLPDLQDDYMNQFQARGGFRQHSS